MANLKLFYFIFPYSTPWITKAGVTYSIGQALIVSSDILPTFVEIADFFISDTDNYLIVVQQLFTVAFVPHYHTYEVLHPSEDEFNLLKQCDLLDPIPLSLYSNHAPNYYITLKYHISEISL